MIINKKIENQEIIISDDAEYLRKIKNENIPFVLVCTENEYEINANDFSFAPYIYLANNNVSEKKLEELVDEEYLRVVIARMSNIPLKIAENRRFCIRELVIEDCESVVKLYENEKYIEPFFENKEEAYIFLKRYIKDVYSFYGYGIWGIYDKNNTLMGITGFTPHDEDIELCYALFNEYRAKNIAYEAVTLSIEYAMKNIEYNNIIIRTVRENLSALKLAKKIEKVFNDIHLQILDTLTSEKK